ncbi:MAG: thiamine pyrophosphate protein domain protein TPP-binding [Ilumatobacteraceae bacterium]|nr:thiamine pyrophosphate protein domain protein TPP-binding [Ilumatobacteraceae bacterium]
MVTGVLDRRDAVSRLLANRGDALVVTGLGSATYDVHAHGDHDANYYLWGAMGGAALVGFGLAQAQPDRRVLVISGDGEQLMALGGLATIAAARPTNLDIVVLDNEHYGETGMQTSHTGLGIDLAAVAAAIGFPDTRVVGSDAELDRLIDDHAAPAGGPRLAVLKIRAENLPRSMPSRDAVFIKNRFRAHLGLTPN